MRFCCAILLFVSTGCAHWHSPPVPKRVTLVSVYAPSQISPNFAVRSPQASGEPQDEVGAILNEVADQHVPLILAGKGFEPVPLARLQGKSDFKALSVPDSKRTLSSLVQSTGRTPSSGWVAAEGYPLLPIQFTRDPRSPQTLEELCTSLGVEGIVLLELRLGYDDGWLRAAPDIQVRPVAASAVAVVEKGGRILYQSPPIGTGAPFISGPAVVALKNRKIEWNETARSAYRSVVEESLSHTLNLLSEPQLTP